MTTDHTTPARLTGLLLFTAVTAMVAGAAVAVPTGLALNPSDPAGVLRAVNAHVGLHLLELALDVLGWLALTAAGLTMAVVTNVSGPNVSGRPMFVLPGGLLAAAGLAGMLHDAGNLAVTQLAIDPSDPLAIAVAEAVLLTAKWAINLAGLVWVAATAAAALCLPMPRALRIAGLAATASGLAAVALPWSTGTGGPSAAMEQAGYALHLPIMIWYAVLAGRLLRRPAATGGVRPDAR